MAIGNNYSVTYGEATGTIGVIANGTFPDASNKCLTRFDCETYLYCDNSYLTTYGTQQLVKYQDIVPAPTYTISFQARIKTSVLNNVVGFWYQLGSNAYVRWQITTISTAPSYSTLTSLTIPQGASLTLACQNSSNVNLVFGVGNGGSYGGYCGKSAAYLVTPTSNTTYYFNIDTTGAGGSLKTC